MYSVKKPEPEDLGLTAEDYQHYLRTMDRDPFESNLVFNSLGSAVGVAASLIAFLITDNWAQSEV